MPRSIPGVTQPLRLALQHQKIESFTLRSTSPPPWQADDALACLPSSTASPLDLAPPDQCPARLKLDHPRPPLSRPRPRP
eukprot:767489-Hanusia_phi.AAC.1